MAAPVVPIQQETPVTRLTCRAPHPDPKKKGDACGSFLGDVHGTYDFITNAAKAPHQPEGFTWLRCPRENCRQWNKWKLLAAAVPTKAEGSVEERLAKFPEIQQQAIMALAGGIRTRQLAQQLDVAERTLREWKSNEEFQALRRELAPVLSATHVRAALASLMELIEKDVKKGVGTHVRYFLNRTVFAEFEKDRAAKGGTAINLNVAQHQQQTQATVKSVWEERQRIAIPAPVAPTE